MLKIRIASLKIDVAIDRSIHLFIYGRLPTTHIKLATNESLSADGFFGWLVLMLI
jgi:hypothetical protein